MAGSQSYKVYFCHNIPIVQQSSTQAIKYLLIRCKPKSITLYCPVLKKLIDSVLWVFNLQDFDNPTAHDILVWHYYFQQSSQERDHGCETFLKLLTMCSMGHVLWKKTQSQTPSVYCTVELVCNNL